MKNTAETALHPEFAELSGRHGEVIYVPVDSLPAGLVPDKAGDGVNYFIIGHSETGHHHVLVGTDPDAITAYQPMTVATHGQLYKNICKAAYGTNEAFWPSEIIPFRAKTDIELRHLRPFDTHETQILKTGVYVKGGKEAYDYTAKRMAKVTD